MGTNSSSPFEGDLKSIIRERATGLAAIAAARFKEACQPIYGATENGLPNHIGSAVLINVHGAKILLTAAHVIDDNAVTSLYVGGGANLEMIEAEFRITIAPKNLRRLDKYDIAFCRLSPALIDKVGSRYIGLDEMAHTPPYEVGRLYTALGFPNTMNKTSARRRLERRIRPEMLQYTNLHRVDEEVAKDLPGNGQDHIFLPYGRLWRDEEGFVTNASSPVGMSGGAVIDCGKAGSPEVASGLLEPTQRLAGIGIEFIRKRVMIATRMSVIIPALLKEIPAGD